MLVNNVNSDVKLEYKLKINNNNIDVFLEMYGIFEKIFFIYIFIAIMKFNINSCILCKLHTISIKKDSLTNLNIKKFIK